MDTFEILLAQYKARVKQLYFDFQDKDSERPIARQSHRSKPKILVIEDSADEWFMIRWTLLKQFRDAESIWLSSTDETRAYMDNNSWTKQNLPRLILLDLYLPSAEAGFTVLKSLKKNKWFATIPIVIMSRSSAVEDIRKAYSYNSNGYMIKPEEYRDWSEAFTILHQYWQDSAGPLS